MLIEQRDVWSFYACVCVLWNGVVVLRRVGWSVSRVKNKTVPQHPWVSLDEGVFETAKNETQLFHVVVHGSVVLQFNLVSCRLWWMMSGTCWIVWGEGGENKTVPQHPPPHERVRAVVVLWRRCWRLKVIAIEWNTAVPKVVRGQWDQTWFHADFYLVVISDLPVVMDDVWNVLLRRLWLGV